MLRYGCAPVGRIRKYFACYFHGRGGWPQSDQKVRVQPCSTMRVWSAGTIQAVLVAERDSVAAKANAR
jgi:hypothetical protein